ncbi:helix-turn-helix domain-containing protein [Streptomyces sp. TR02-1]|uniref:helix-turn-helix domain-containing protein n=1 Tax=Streptomyces sp. TR02-1 TaxID=3385977 RepID=UPI0039A1B365
MQIARGLLALRERAGLTQGQLADKAGCSKATVGRYEVWQDRAKVKWATVKAMAEACGATAAEREALVALAKSQGEGWWVGNKAVPAWMDPLISFEAAGDFEHVYANSVVPGLLQTRPYAFALHQAHEARTPPEEIERMVDARMQRQTILDRDPPLHLWVVLDEAVLHRIVGDHQVMADQLDHLHRMAQHPHIDLQVLPFALGAHAGAGGHFVIIGRTDESEPRNAMSVVYIESRASGFYLDDGNDVAAYKVHFDYLRSAAADSAASSRMLADAGQEFSR